MMLIPMPLEHMRMPKSACPAMTFWTDGLREIVVVDRVLRIRAEVRDGIAPAGEVLADHLLQFQPGVIAADGDTEPFGCSTRRRGGRGNWFRSRGGGVHGLILVYEFQNPGHRGAQGIAALEVGTNAEADRVGDIERSVVPGEEFPQEPHLALRLWEEEADRLVMAAGHDKDVRRPRYRVLIELSAVLV
jgi:hypothetical protein